MNYAMSAIKTKLISLPKKWYFWLFIITGIAIFLRVLPAFLNPAWGCDFGIYYGLTNTFERTGALFNQYYGWGDTYQYFPVLYAVTGAAHWITGIDTLVLMPKIIPIFGGLSVFIFYFIVYELLKDRKKALLASLLLAVLPFHVYQTSHAAPLTFGHFFMMLSLFCFIKFRKNNWYCMPLLASTVLLIMSHHLTTYFYLISLIFIVFMENLGERTWTPSVKKDSIYILATSGLIFSYWMFVAKPVFASFMNTGMRIGALTINSTLLLVLFYIAFFSLFGFIWMKRRLDIFRVKKELTLRGAALRVLATVIFCVSAMSVFMFVKMPWTNFSFTPTSIIYSLPLVIVLGFGFAGFRATRFTPNGGFVRGWLLAILISLAYGLITNSGILFPDRHFEYLMAPLSIIALYGINTVFLKPDYSKVVQFGKNTLKNLQTLPFSRKTAGFQKRQIIYAMVIFILVMANAVSVYPGFASLNAADETITDPDLAVISWMNEYSDKNTTIIASDHRLARMTEAVGFNTTIDEAYLIWTAENLSACLPELRGDGKNYSRITHVIIDDIMKNEVVHVGYGQIYYMTNASYEKFLQQPFELLYRNATLNENMEEEHWAEVFAVNWTYLD
jgi:hypothetical protein